MRCNIAIMKRFLPIIILFITNILSSQVTNHSEGERVFKRDFIGKHYSEIIKTLGPYDSKSEDGLGGSIYTWEVTEGKINFYCDSGGFVYNVKFNEFPTIDYQNTEFPGWIYCLFFIALYLEGLGW